MAAILLDIDGVFHVSGKPILGAAEAVSTLRERGHRLRFVTNTTVRTRRVLTAELKGFGVDVRDDELQTTAAAAVRALRGRRVLALTMPSVVEDLDGLDLVGEDADAVLVGGADEGDETGRVFSYMNLARAFAELQTGADLYCLHKNRWWQTSRGPLLDSGAFVAGLEYAAGVEAVVIGKPSPMYFEAALEALDAEPKLTWMVGDDIEADIAGAQKFGLRTALVRTGKFRPDDLERIGDRAGHRRQLARRAARLAGEGAVTSVGIDLIEIERIRRAIGSYPSFTARCFTEAERAYCDSRPNPAQHYAARFAGKEAVGKALGFGVARAFAWREVEIVGRPKPSVQLTGGWSSRQPASAWPSVDLSMTHSKELAAAIAIASSD